MPQIEDAVGVAVAVGLATFFLGMIVGANQQEGTQQRQIAPYVKQRHDYAEIRIISQQGPVVVRAVESPGLIDDRSIETLVNGVLVSRSHPDSFDEIWKQAGK